MKDTFDLHQWFFNKYSLYENDDPKIGAEEEGDPNEYVVGENESLKYSISEYIADNKNININDIKNYLNELKTLAEEKSTLCKRGQDYIKSRKSAGEKSSAYLSGRGVKVCKGQISFKGKKLKSWSESLSEDVDNAYSIKGISIVYTEEGQHYDTKVTLNNGKRLDVPNDLSSEELSEVLKRLKVYTDPSIFEMDYEADSSDGLGSKDLDKLNSALKQANITLDIDRIDVS